MRNSETVTKSIAPFSFNLFYPQRVFEMKLWLLKRKDSVNYDEYDSFVVKARNEKEARKLAQEKGRGSWASEENVECTVLSTKGNAEVILGSFNAG